MSVLVLGAGGLLGRALVRHPGTVGLTHAQLDITDAEAVAAALAAVRPSAVINAAALAAVDRATQEPALAWGVNAEAPGSLAALCLEQNIRLVHISTDYVLDGPDAPGARLLETDRPSPQSVYARSKRGGELAALAHDAVVVRIQWAYALTGQSFLARALVRLRAGEPLSLVTDQLGCPTPANWLVSPLMDCAAGGPTGLFHLATGGEASAHQWVMTAAEALGVPTGSVTRCTRSDLGGAYRPARSCLDSTRFLTHWPRPHLGWDQALLAEVAKLTAG